MTIYYFWVTPDGANKPGYIELCLQSWQKSLPSEDIVRVDYRNVSELTGGLLTPELLKRYSLAHQSDIVCAVVLARHGGVFLDADTIVMPKFADIVFDDTLPTFFGTPKTVTLAMMIAPQPELSVLTEWRDAVLQTLRAHSGLGFRLRAWFRRKVLKKKPRLHWSLFGGLLLDPIVDRGKLAGTVIVEDIDQSGSYPIEDLVGPPISPTSYRKVWLTDQFTPSEVVQKCRFGFLLLQNSWHTPEYNALTSDEVLRDKSLLSRTLQLVLGKELANPDEAAPDQ